MNRMYQVSTLQALAMGYTRSVVTVGELRSHGTTGLGTFNGVDGEMIMIDGRCYRAKEDGSVFEADDEMGVPFASVSNFKGERSFVTEENLDIGKLKDVLNNKIEEKFGLNSMHIVTLEGEFEVVHARSESPTYSIHVSLKEILSKTQKSFEFDNIKGTMVCVYYPDYMDGINASGWHLHFISDDRTRGGHVFELKMKAGASGKVDKINNIELQLPLEPVFDTYSLKQASDKEIKQVEQGKE